ncbi:MAG: hypothetical protein HY869_12375 [Chloroflexi bacterium]|nr:hypothetical protein [Chloroflexota bacterium]
MTNCTVLSKTAPPFLPPAKTGLDNLPARLGKRLWVTPTEFLQTTHAMQIAHWAVNLSLAPRLPKQSRRGSQNTVFRRKHPDDGIYTKRMADGLRDYFRSHPEAARQAGFENGQVISIGQYWERRRALGAWVFWLFFVGMVWQL